MMRIIFVVMLPLAWSYGQPNSRGGGAFAYVDTSGNRYGGTYGLKDGKLVSSTGDAFPPPGHYADNAYQGDDFGSSYFANLENLLQEAFKTNLENQKLAFNAAKKAFDLTSNQAAGYIPYHDPTPNFATRFPEFNPEFNNFPSFGFPVPGFGIPPPMSNFPNSAFASAHARPGFSHHVDSIYPANPANPNVDVNHFSDMSGPNNKNGFYSVSSKSYASSSNVNGKENSNRGAETVVNNNGQVTHYKVST